MATEEPGTARVLDAIRKHKPSSIRVTMADGEQREVDVRGGRSRWTPAARTVIAYGWARLELLGPKGTVLAVLDNAAAVAGAELADDAKPGTVEARELHLLRIMNAHADLAVQRHIEALKPTLQAMQMQVQALAEQLVHERRAAAATMESAADLAEQLARVARTVQESGGSGGELGPILEAMPMLLKLLPMAQPPAPQPAPRPRPRVVVVPPKPPAAAEPSGTT